MLLATGSPHGVLPTFGVCAQPESVATPKCCPFPSWAFAPPSRLWLPGLTMPLTTWLPLMTLARWATEDCSPVGRRAGPSASPPRGAVPASLDVGPPPWRFWPAALACCHSKAAGPGKRSSEASRPVSLRTSLQGVPRLLPAKCLSASGSPLDVSHVLGVFRSAGVRRKQGASSLSLVTLMGLG